MIDHPAAFALTLAFLLGACSAGEDRGADLTRRERDSIIAQSRLPGAGGVGAAMRAADSIEARLRIADTIGP